MFDEHTQMTDIPTTKDSDKTHMIDTADNNQQWKLNLMNNSENVLGVMLKGGVSFYYNKWFINIILHINQLPRMYISKNGQGQL